MHPLDNACWHALTGAQQRFAQGSDLARRYDPEVAVFAALPDTPTPDAWAALRDLVGPGQLAVLFRDVVATPPGWRELFRLPTLQMLAPADGGALAETIEELGPADTAEMLRLAEHARPGPFFVRTHELGTYLGLREAGALVAMAGERVRPAGYSEISAVSTQAEHRGRGFATLLIRDLTARIQARVETAYLHVAEENVTAIRLYEKLGFTTRRMTEAVGLLAPA